MQWVTGAPLGLDGSACVWLVRRFVDRTACFRFVAPDAVTACARAAGDKAVPTAAAMALGNTMPDRCGFLDLAELYRLDDPALRAMAGILRAACGADAAQEAESPGLRLIGRGLPLVAADEVIAERSGLLFDALYAALQAYPPSESRAAREARALAWFWLR